ncbi:unnamed protein product [Periconia digitata]|uniref:Uncharacterized protein n=1 Tax=Periconia digitata TaxID=1303443 RepID=A0A9W4UU46_9PLEO|nr:unnamed protein product [Periconia digitata]
MGSSHSSAGQMAASFKTPPFAPPNRFHGRRHLQRYCICPHCSYNYRAGRRGCDACGNRWKQKFGERLAVPEQPHHVRQVRSIDGGELNQIMQLGLPEEAKRDLLGSCVGKYEPSRKPVDDDGNDEEVSTASVDVLGNHAGAHNPSIILTSVDDAKPTMDSCTWGALEMGKFFLIQRAMWRF